MDEGDHTEYPVELLACPEHLQEQQSKMKDARRDSGSSWLRSVSKMPWTANAISVFDSWR